MPSATEITEYIRTLEGTPYAHQGRLHVNGTVDCLGLILAVCRHFRLTDYDCTEYGLQAFGYRIIEFCEQECQRLDKIEPACLLVFKIRVLPQHLGFYLGDGRICHGAGASGVKNCHDKRVQVVTFDQKWRDRVVGIYRLPGVDPWLP